MTREELKEKIIDLARESTGAELTDGRDLKESGLDSLSLVTVIAGIEELFGFFFDDDDLQPDKLVSLNDLAELTEKYMTDNISGRTITYVYDSLDRVISYTDKLASNNTIMLTETYTYNDDGTLASRAIMGEVTQTYGYVYKANAAHDLDYFTVGELKVSPKTDCLGRSTGKAIAVSNEKVYEEIITYRKVGDHATNMPGTIRYGDKQNGTFGIRDSLKYTYDEMGNISKVYENGDLSVRYTYDKLSRLVREDNKAIGETYLFDYDNNGNILNKRTMPFTLKSKEETEELNSTAKEYTYDGDKLLSYNGESFAYDGLGNPTTYRGKTLTWTKCRRLIDYNGITFTYDGQGRRKTKGSISYCYGSDGKLLGQSNGLEFIYDGTGVLGFIYSGNTYLYRKDIFGNITKIVDKNGKIIVQYKYDAWGNHVVEDEQGNEIKATGHIGNLNPFRYRGYYYDVDTGLYFLKTRYYDPEIGRFITIDDISYLDPDTINGLNLYAYCGNNPVMYVDPEGTWSWSKFWKTLAIIAGAVLVVGAIAAITVVTGGAAAPVLLGAGTGFLTSGGISAMTQLATTGKLDLAQLFVDAAFGAITGAFGGSTLGIIGMAIASGVTGFASSVTSDLVAGREVQWGLALASGAISAFFGALSGGGAQNGQNATLKSKMRLMRQKKAAGKPVKALAAQIKNERKLLSQFGCNALKPDEGLIYDLILEYVAYTVLPVIYNRGRM